MTQMQGGTRIESTHVQGMKSLNKVRVIILTLNNSVSMDCKEMKWLCKKTPLPKSTDTEGGKT